MRIVYYQHSMNEQMSQGSVAIETSQKKKQKYYDDHGV